MKIRQPPSSFPFVGNLSPGTDNRRRFTIPRRSLLKVITVFFVCHLLLALWGHSVLTSVSNTRDRVPSSAISTQEKPQNKRPPDGHFNGYPVYFHDLTKNITYHSRPYSIIQCAGENYQGEEASWMQRSCYFRFLCWNISSQEFEVYSRPVDEPLQPWMTIPKDEKHPLLMDMTSSVTHNSRGSFNSVSLGGIRPEWIANSTLEEKRQHPLKWFPRVVDSSAPERYYALDEDVVFAPFHSMAGWDQWSLLWDDLFPIYNLLHMFQLHDQGREPLLMRMALKNEKLWPSCEDDETKQQCSDNFKTFRSLFSRRHASSSQLSTQLDAVLEPIAGLTLQSDLVCARHGVAGTGPLTSAGTRDLLPNRQRRRKKKKKRKKDSISNNIGRGALFWKFRNYCLQNMGLQNEGHRAQEMPLKITFAVASEQELKIYQDAVKTTIKGHNVQMEMIEIGKMDAWMNQVRTAMTTTVFVTASSRAVALATFLPWGATVIFISPNDGTTNGNSNPMTFQRQDLDVLNHLSYVGVHWLPGAPISFKQNIAVFLDIVGQQIKIQECWQHETNDVYT